MDTNPPAHSATALQPLPATESAATSAAERLRAAQDALEASRAVLRRELIPQQAGAAGAVHASPWREPLRHLRRLRKLAGRWEFTRVAAQALEGWWRQQPWHETAELLGGSVLLRGRATVRRHPLLAVGVAAGAGAWLVSRRPWRWPLVSAQLRPVPHHLVSWVLQQFMTAPVQAALAGLLLKSIVDGDAATDPNPSDNDTDGDEADGSAGPLGAAAVPSTEPGCAP